MYQQKGMMVWGGEDGVPHNLPVAYIPHGQSSQLAGAGELTLQDPRCPSHTKKQFPPSNPTAASTSDCCLSWTSQNLGPLGISGPAVRATTNISSLPLPPSGQLCLLGFSTWPRGPECRGATGGRGHRTYLRPHKRPPRDT